MANSTVTCAAGEWTLLTDSDVTTLRAQNLTARSVVLQATAGASPEPSSTAASIVGWF